jgi:hypothetical protein
MSGGPQPLLWSGGDQKLELCSPNACSEYAIKGSRGQRVCARCAGVFDPVGCVGVEVGVGIGEVDYGFGHFGWMGWGGCFWA